MSGVTYNQGDRGSLDFGKGMLGQRNVRKKSFLCQFLANVMLTPAITNCRCQIGRQDQVPLTRPLLEVPPLCFGPVKVFCAASNRSI